MSIYDTKQWKRLRAKVLRERPWCSMCAWEGRQTPATQVDHITPIEQGGEPYDETNLSAKCLSCHSRKTRIMDVGGKDRVAPKGCDASGKPNDPGHWWRSGKNP